MNIILAVEKTDQQYKKTQARKTIIFKVSDKMSSTSVSVQNTY